MSKRGTWLIAALCLSISACTISTQGRREVVVRSPPPAARVEVRPVAPSSTATWVSGHWEYRDGRYYWVRGRYVELQPGYVYEPGRWERRGESYVWIEPRWVPLHPSRPTVVVPSERRGAYRYDYD